MTKERYAADPGDPYDFNRFISAQEGIYDRVLAELRDGQKRTHWMWYIFPQIDGLGHSPTTRLYAIKSVEEAGDTLLIPFSERGSWKARKRSLLFRGDRFLIFSDTLTT